MIFDINYLEEVIRKTYGDDVTISGKAKTLSKFGRNDNVGTTEETVWLLGNHETYQTSNTIDTVVSDDAGDTQDVRIEGHTVDGSGNFTFITQTATLNGTTNVSLGTPLARANRLFNTGSTDLSGTVTVFEDGGTTHLSTDGANNQSLKCATTVSNVDYWVITSWKVSVRRDASQTRRVDFKLQVREKGSVFRTKDTMACSTEIASVVNSGICLIIPPNSDVRVTATSSGSTTVVDSTLNGFLARKKY